MSKIRLTIGISGASGAPVAVEILKTLAAMDQVETHLVVSRGAEETIRQEVALSLEEVLGLADVVHDNQNIGAAIASGSFKTAGMIVAPCSMKTLAGIASGYSDTLLLRAADVTLKESRRLVLVTRECPLSAVHLRNMLELARQGVVILPPMLTYYNHPVTIDDMTRHIAAKCLDLFDIEHPGFRRWGNEIRPETVKT